MTIRVDFGPCCFCARQIAETDVDPCRVTVATKGEKWQRRTCLTGAFLADCTRRKSAGARTSCALIAADGRARTSGFGRITSSELALVTHLTCARSSAG